MIDWRDGVVVRLGPCAIEEVMDHVAPFLRPGERVVGTFKAFRDYLVITSRRFIAVNATGLSGRRKHVSIFPMSQIIAYGVTSPGGFDTDSELRITLRVVKTVRFRFRGDVDTTGLSHTIGTAMYS